MADSPEQHAAPEGACCAEHPERAAHFTCPRCGSYACLSCFQPALGRCQRCLARDPTEAAPPLPWEQDDGRSAVVRYAATLASALRPIRSAPALARDGLAPAFRFAALSALPFAMLAGVIPHTRTLLFKGSFAVLVLGHPSTAEIALDVARASLVQTCLTAISLACLLLPFTSLVRAYAPQRWHAAARVLLYRIWLLPGALLFFYLASLALPTPDQATLEQAPPLGFLLVLGVRFWASVLLMLSMGATARVACGLKPLMAFVVVLVPVVLWSLVDPLAARGFDLVLPKLETGAE